jgi:dTDP-4-amino-4,6-dideoxygalactose transaminase
VLVEPDQRDAFRKHLQDGGIATAIHYPRTIPRQKALRNQSFDIQGELTHAEDFAEGEVSLPIHPYLSDEEVERVVRRIADWKLG